MPDSLGTEFRAELGVLLFMEFKNCHERTSELLTIPKLGSSLIWKEKYTEDWDSWGDKNANKDMHSLII